MYRYQVIVLVFLFGAGVLLKFGDCAPPRCPRSDDIRISIYTHMDYKGTAENRCLPLDNRCVRLGHLANKVSSIKTTGCVQLCRDEHCHNCEEVTQDYANLSAINLNDAAVTLRKCGTGSSNSGQLQTLTADSSDIVPVFVEPQSNYVGSQSDSTYQVDA